MGRDFTPNGTSGVSCPQPERVKHVALEIALVIARIALIGFFLVAAIVKLLDLRGGVKALKEFGLPARAAGPLALLVPVAEIVVAALLASEGLLRWGAAGASSLLVIFSVVLSGNLVRGRRPECHCFGKLSLRPIGWSTVARNVLLAAVAGLVAWRASDAGIKGWGTALVGQGRDAAALLLAATAIAIVLVLVWAIVHLICQNGRLLIRIENLEQRLTVPNAGHTSRNKLGGAGDRFHSSVV
jgi:hypothetical protein